MKAEGYRFIATALAVPLAVFVVFMISPYAQAVAYSLTDWKGFSNERNFIGLDNYLRLFRDVAIDSFAIVQIMTVGPGGPSSSTDVMALQMYNTAFVYNDYGYASAIGVMLCLITVVIAGTATWLSKGRDRA